jgi:diadenosine tetraphosphate (Ap4A) HIT family hydrolase
MRVPFDLHAYEQATRGRDCFICAMQAGTLDYQHEVIYDDGEHFAFVARNPQMYGYVLVCPKRHVEHVVRDLDEDAYLRLQAIVHRVARVVEAVTAPERTYLLSLGSQQGNSHVHWHIAPLPAGVPYEQQQYYALMHENGVIPWSKSQEAALADALRERLG